MSIEVINHGRRLPRSSAGFVLVLMAWTLAYARSASAFTTWGPLPPLAERIADHEIAVVATCISAKRDFPEHDNPRQAEVGESVFQIDWVARGPASVAPEQRITVSREAVMLPGRRYLIFGVKQARGIVWDVHVSISLAMTAYLQGAPDALAPPELRLAYFLEFLESPNPEIAADALEAFSQARHADLKSAAESFAPDVLRDRLRNPDLSFALQGVYGLLLGYAGDEADVALLEELVSVDHDVPGFGPEWLMTGYLLLAREGGLDFLDNHKLRRRENSFSDQYSAFRALRHSWTHARERFAPERLKQSMRILLDRPQLADLVVSDLATLRDWSCLPQVMQIYDHEDYNNHVKRAIIKYLIAASRDRPEAARQPVPKHVVQSTRFLQELRKKDPLLVAAAERTFKSPW